MNGEQRERLLDSVLDRALGPQVVEPRPGLEERILANLPGQPQRRLWWQWLWVPALAAAAVLAVVIGMKFTHRETPAPQIVKKTIEKPKQEIAVTPTPLPEPRQQVAKQIAPRVKPPTARMTLANASPALPRLDVFPAPVPDNDQERLLRALSNRQRREVELVALNQAASREKVQKYFETGEVPETVPLTSVNMR